jgi:hypothetical protein
MTGWRHQVARRRLRAAGRRGAAEAQLRPAHHRDAARDAREVADGVEGDLRVVRARLHADVAAGEVGIELVPRQRRQRRERLGLPAREPEAVLARVREERRAEA